MLVVKQMSVSYGAFEALRKIDLHVNDREIVALVGPNGAGKSTALKAISGLLRADGGSITEGEVAYGGASIANVRTDELTRLGISLIPEGRRVFASMTVRENLEMGGYACATGVSLTHDMNMAFELFPILAQRLGQRAGTLSGGEQQMLAIARALMARPKLLLADEPSLGLSPNYVDAISLAFQRIRAQGASILLVEQNARMAFDLCDRAYVFLNGAVAGVGTRDELRDENSLRDIFLGLRLG